MGRLNATLLILIIVFVALGGALVFLKLGTPKSSLPSSTSPKSSQTTGTAQPPMGGVTYQNGAFSPNPLRFQSAGSAILVFTNNGASDIDIESDPHPTHTDHPILNLGVIHPKQVKSIILTQPGTYKFHNHLNPSEHGQVELVR